MLSPFFCQGNNRAWQPFIFNEIRRIAQELASADSKGLMGALSPLLCISFELHKIGAILGILKGPLEPGWRERGADNSKSCLELTQLDSMEVNKFQYLL
jgi:hypothetical protein